MSYSDPDSVSWLRFAFASTTVIGLMGLLGWGLKVASLRGWFTGAKEKGGDLSCIASMPLDVRRRVVVVKRNGIEYLLLLGPNNDVLLSEKPSLPSAISHESEGT